jgi:hypothetical protein
VPFGASNENRGSAAVFFFPERPMKNLQEATERICDLKGSLVALDALVTALLDQMPDEARADPCVRSRSAPKSRARCCCTPACPT